MPQLSPSTLRLIVGILIIVVLVIGYQLYQDRQQPKGMQINVGPGGISIKEK